MISIWRDDEGTDFVRWDVFEVAAGSSECCKTFGYFRTAISENI